MLSLLKHILAIFFFSAHGTDGGHWVLSPDYWVGGWMGDNILSKLLQESDSLMGNVGASVVMENAYACGQHSFSPVLNCQSELFQSLTVPVSIYWGPGSHEVNQQCPFFYSKTQWHDLTNRLCVFEFLQLGVKWNAQVLSPMTIKSNNLPFS